MNDLDVILTKYVRTCDHLMSVVSITEKRALDGRDDLVADNVNFFVKLYMTILCSYLEAFLKEIASACANRVNERLIAAKVPHNYLYSTLVQNGKPSDFGFYDANYPLSDKMLSDRLSGNPGKTIKCYMMLGIELSKNIDFMARKDLVGPVVEKGITLCTGMTTRRMFRWLTFEVTFARFLNICVL